MKNCLTKLHAQLKDFDTSEVTRAAAAYRSRGREDQAANIAAVEDHLRDLRQQRVRLETQILAAWKERDPQGFTASGPAADIKLKGETNTEVLDREKSAPEEQRKREERAIADRERDHFGLQTQKAPAAPAKQDDLFGGPKAEDLANAKPRGVAKKTTEGQDSLFEPVGTYGKTEAFAVRAAQGEGPGFALKSANGQLDLFSAGTVPSLPGGARPIFATEIAPAKRGELRIGFDRIDSPEKAAHVFAHLRKMPREYFQALVLDKDDKPIAYLDLYRGDIASVSVPPSIILMSTFQTPGAAKLWISHNHPSGIAEPSVQDQSLTRNIQTLINGTGIRYAGHVIIAGRKAYSLEEFRPFNIPPASRKFTVPIMERHVVKSGKLGKEAVTSPGAARALVTSLSNGDEGMLLLDTQNKPVGYFPMDIAEASKLRTDDSSTGFGKLAQAFAKSGASAAIIYSPNDQSNSQKFRMAVGNLEGALEGLSVKVLDAITGSAPNIMSWAERGLLPGGNGFFSRPAESKEVAVAIARKELDSVVERLGLKAKVIESETDLPAHLREQIAAEGAGGDVRGAFDPTTGEVWLVRDKIGSEAEGLFVALHESAHRGLTKLFGADLKPVLEHIYLTNKNVRKAADKLRKQYNYSQARATEEVLADMAMRGQARNLKGWQRFVEFLRKWLVDHGFKVQVTDEMAEFIAGAAAQAGKDTAHSLTGEDSGRFARTEQLPEVPAEAAPQRPPQRPSLPLEGGESGNQASWDAPEPTKLDTFIYSLQNKQIDMKKVVAAIRTAGSEIADRWNPYLQEELYHGRTAKFTQDFIDKELKPLFSDMAARGVDMRELEKYLHARHAEERNEQIARVNPDMPDGGSGMTTEASRDYLDSIEEPKRRAFEVLARRVDAITKRSRALLVEYGLEAPETIAAWEGTYEHYVPLMREDADHSTGTGTGQGYSVKGSASKRATGSSRNVVDILANIAMQRERAIVRGEKNRVALALYGLAKLNPNTDFWKVDQPPTVRGINERTGLVEDRVDPLYKSRDNVVMARVYNPRTGKIQELSVIFEESDERAMRMAHALKNLDADQLGHVLGASAKVTRYFASINTQYNPVFGIINLTRDVQSAMLNLSTTPIRRKRKEVLQATLSALRGIYIDLRDTRAGEAPTSSWAQLWEEFQREGGQTGYRDMFATSKERAEALEDEIKRISEGSTKRAGRAVFDWLSDYNAAGENAVRLAAYKVGKDTGMSNQQAASMAKNLTVNFNRKGQVAVQAGALYAFFNASAQGTARTLETLAGPAGKKIVMGGLIVGAAQAIMLAAAGFDDDEPPQFVREKSLVIPIGGKKYIAIPMPQGFNVIPNVSRTAVEYVLSGFKGAGKRVANLTGVFADSLNPIGSAGLSLQTLTPTVIDPLAALAENKDFTGRPIAKEDKNTLSPTPGHTRAKDTASWWSRMISQGLNSLTGGSKYSPGALSPTPDQIDFLIGQGTGGLGREVSKLAQSTAAAVSGEEVAPYKIPLIGRVYGDAETQSAQSNKFYANITAMNAHEAEIKGRRKDGEPVAEYLKDNPEARLFQAANTVERRVSELRAKKREAVAKERSQNLVKLLEAQITVTMTRFNNQVEAARSAK